MVASRPDQSPSKPEAESTSWVVDPVKGSMTDVVVVSTVDRSGSVTVERVVSTEDATGSVTVVDRRGSVGVGTVVSTVDRSGSVTVERVVSTENATGSVTVEAACVGVVVAEADVDGVEEEVVDNVTVTG